MDNREQMKLFERKGATERLIALSIAFVFYTVFDIAAGKLVFFSNYETYAGYYWLWQIFLYFEMLWLAFTYRSLALPFALFLLSVNGFEDFCYYFFQLQAIPASLPWMAGDRFLLFSNAPTNLSLMFGVLWSIPLIVIAGFMKERMEFPAMRKRLNRKALEANSQLGSA